MRDLLEAGRLLLLDMASTIFFLVVLLLTKNLPLSVALGIALGFAQIGWQWTREKPIDVMQWMSLVAVMASGAATLISHDPRFVMVKPSLIYIVVGLVMLRPGWMNRYLPPVTSEKVSDIAVIFGFAWAALMFFSAALNLFVALNFGVVAWSTFMTIYGIVSKAGMVLIQHATMRYIGGRRAWVTAAPS
jgi:intracellular septation protein